MTRRLDSPTRPYRISAVLGDQRYCGWQYRTRSEAEKHLAQLTQYAAQHQRLVGATGRTLTYVLEQAT